MINKVILVGHVGVDPEVKRFDSNTPKAKFSLATSETYTDKQGVRQTVTEWHNVVVWRGLAEVVEKYVRKGTLLYIEGSIHTRSYDDANGVKKYITEIVVETLKMLGGKRDGDSQTEHAYAQANSNAISNKVEEIEAAGGDDLPF